MLALILVQQVILINLCRTILKDKYTRIEMYLGAILTLCNEPMRRG